MEKQNKNEKTDQNKKLLVLTQELKLARVLAGNNKTSRDKALKSLTKWLKQRSQTMPYSEDDFLRLWKGLFYSMWQSDKPLVQEECAENISKLIHSLPLNTSLLFFKAGIQTLINEWFGIDQLRLDKFLMFTRRLLRQTLIVLKDDKFTKTSVDHFGEILSGTILNNEKKPPLGLFMHFTEIYLEELSKIGGEIVSPQRVVDFLKPFIIRLAASNDGREIAHIRKFIFTYLIRQSDLGLEYQEKYNAWKKEGFPGSIDAMQKVPVEEMDADESGEEAGDEEEAMETSSGAAALDPRAGRVDVELPQLKFQPKEVSRALLAVKFDKQSTTKTRKMISTLAEQFEKLGNGDYPLGAKKLDLPKKEECDTSVRKAVNRLVKFEKKLMGVSKKDKKKRKRALEATAANGEEDEEENGAEDRANKKKKMDVDNVQDADTDSDVDVEEVQRYLRENEKKMQEKKRRLQDEIDEIEFGERCSRVNTENLEAFVRRRDIDQIRQRQRCKARRARKRAFNYGFGLDRRYADEAEFTFERNSGTWVVHRELDSSDDLNASNADLGSFLAEKLESDAGLVASPPKLKPASPKFDDGSPSRKKSPGKTVSPPKGQGSPPKQPGSSKANGNALSPLNLFQSSPSEKSEVFPGSEWDEPLKEGEYEIVVPAKKYAAKMKSEAKNNNQSVQEVVNDSLTKLKGKNRFSLDSKLAKIPFCKRATPSSSKKVKINMGLNQSQEVHEHLAQLVSSPGIPFDANKKPSKPLLKPTGSTPINPFYKRPKNKLF
ncbi:unnamed protein product [Brassicogethes aeneus]|uniref:Uncharacterized protein n=1 Tax=Brassicogethes aeneus TaxID=1431903 RepID=A0A9P0AUA5_BRAAE|nr:unnamed protein product [Brassicogethes aeneus]